jgi:hypothetical protein
LGVSAKVAQGRPVITGSRAAGGSISRRKKLAPESKDNAVLLVETSDTREQLISTIAVGGVGANTATMLTYTQGMFGEGDFTHAVEAVRKNIEASKGGDTSFADTLLISQAASLNAIYTECMRRAAVNSGTYPDATDRYMRLGFKAQSQCRATLESLARIKNPPGVAFVRQANIAHGPQQVNNGMTAESGVSSGDRAHAQNSKSAPIELLEKSDGKWMDTRAAVTAGTGDPALATVGQVHWADDGRGQGGRER